MREVGVHRWSMVPLITLPCDQATICECEQVWIETVGSNLNTNSSVSKDAASREYDKQRHRKNKETKRFYCGICDIAFMHNYNLKRHLDTLKHSYAYMNSVD